jgi:hypothetical protein
MIRKINGITYNPPADYGDTATTSVGTTETILNSVLVPANTFKIYDIVGIQTRIRKTTTNATINLRLRIGTTLNTSQTQVGIFTSASSAHSYIPFDRRLSIQSTTTDTRVLVSTTSYVSDYGGAFPSDMTTLSIDWTSDNYIIITGQTTTSTDTLNCGYIYLDLIQPDA